MVTGFLASMEMRVSGTVCTQQLADAADLRGLCKSRRVGKVNAGS